MTQPQVSPLHQINQTLIDYNPFAKPPVMRGNDVWGDSFIDFPAINAHASDLVFKALQNIHTGLYKATSLLITAEPGTGKTHVIGRIHHQLQKDGKGLFVYVNEHDINYPIKEQFQQKLSNSLGKIGSFGVMQWQEIAALMAKNCHPQLKTLKNPQQLLSLLAREPDQDKVNRILKDLVKRYCHSHEVEDPDIVQAIFWTLSPNKIYRSSAIKWLGGQELAEKFYKGLDLPSKNQSFDAVIEILKIIGHYKELVICFDELDIKSINPENGLHISVIIAELIKDLFDNLSKGVILTVTIPGVWRDYLRELPQAIRQRVNTETGETPLKLEYINDNSIIDFVSWYLESYYQNHQLIPPSPIYPFTEETLKKIGREKPKIREVLQWCKENCHPPNGNEDQPIESKIESYFLNEMEGEIEDSELDDNNLIADALFFSLKGLIGKTIEKVKLEEVTDKVIENKKKDISLNFKIMGKEANQNVVIGVAVLQYANGRALGSGLKKLNDYEKFGLTRGCLVRSEDRKWTPHIDWTYIKPLIKEKGGEYVPLKKDELKPLLALLRVHKKQGVDYDFTEQEFQDFINTKGQQYFLGEYNELLKEILSDPSYEIPTNLVEDESENQEEIVNNHNNETDDFFSGFSAIDE